jgi:hypothetical protein
VHTAWQGLLGVQIDGRLLPPVNLHKKSPSSGVKTPEEGAPVAQSASSKYQTPSFDAASLTRVRDLLY